MKKPRYYYSVPATIATEDVLYLYDEPTCVISRTKKKSCPRVTICGIWDTEENTMSFGVTRCSEKDIFVKSEGRKIAYDRALNAPSLVVKIDRAVPDVFMDNCIELEATHLHGNHI